jgi:hypothetical protein
MKKYSIFFVFISYIGFTQNNDSISFKKNEIKVDFFSLLVLNKASVSYERLLNEDFSVGVSLLKTTQSHIENQYNSSIQDKIVLFQITPYIRYNLHYFNPKSVIYGEIFSTYNEGRFREISRFTDGFLAYYEITDNDFTDVALGGSLGYKHIIFKQVLIDVNVGLGRNIFSTNSQQIIPRVGFNIGYGF